MKFIVLLLLVTFSYSVDNDNLQERLKSVQQSQDQIYRRQKRVPLIPMEARQKSEESATEAQVQPPLRGSDRITRLEVSQQYIQRDLERAEKTLNETRESLIEVVTTLENQNKISEAQTDKSSRVDLILNILLGIVSFFGAGSGVLAWKNKHLIWSKRKDKETLKEK